MVFCKIHLRITSYNVCYTKLLRALVQGGIQAMSRSYYSKMIPAEYAAEFFGFYNFLGKFATVLGPLLIGAVALTTHSSRAGIASVAVFFILGAVLLAFVDDRITSYNVCYTKLLRAIMVLASSATTLQQIVMCRWP